MPRRNNRIVYETKEITLESLNSAAHGCVKPECRSCLLFGYGFDSCAGKCAKGADKKPAERNGDRAKAYR